MSSRSLTEAVNDLLFDPRRRLTRQQLRGQTTVHFVSYAPGDLFIAGQTPEARDSMDITLELSDWGCLPVSGGGWRAV